MHCTKPKIYEIAALAMLVTIASTGVASPYQGVLPETERLEQERMQQERLLREEAGRLMIPALRGDGISIEPLPETEESFVLQGILFSRSVFLDDMLLRDISGAYVGLPITTADLNRMLEKINAVYDERGLITARAIIPPQEIEDGRLRVLLVEASLQEVVWNTEPRGVGTDFFVSRMAMTEPGEILDPVALMHEIQRFNDLSPGPLISASLAPGDEFGTTRLLYDVFEPQPRQWRLSLSNYGGETTGEMQLGIDLSWYSPFGRSDELTASLIGSEGTLYGTARYRTPVGAGPLLFNTGVGLNQIKIMRGPFRELEVEGQSSHIDLGLERMFWRSPAWLYGLRGGMSYGTSETTILGGLPLGETQQQRLTLAGYARYRTERLFLRYEQELDWTSHHNKVTDVKNANSSLKGTGLGQYTISSQWRVLGRVRWQYANETSAVPPAMLFSLGGLSSVRGYDAGILAGPYGFDMSAELHRAISESWSVAALLDYGQVFEVDGVNPSISSIGVYSQYHHSDQLNFNAVFAQAGTRVTPEQDMSKLWLRAEWRF